MENLNWKIKTAKFFLFAFFWDASYSPIRFSAAFNVNASNMTRSLTPFELTAMTAILSNRSESKPVMANAGCTDDRFAISMPVCWSIISMRNHCRWPPSNPTLCENKIDTLFDWAFWKNCWHLFYSDILLIYENSLHIGVDVCPLLTAPNPNNIIILFYV